MRVLVVVGSVLVACAGVEPGPADEPAPTRAEEQELVPVAVESEVSVVPTDWVTVKASCGYGFRAPAGLIMQDVTGLDSCVNKWAAGNCVYLGDYGAFSSDLREYEQAMQYEGTEESIDGRAAKLVTAVSDEFLAAVHFPRVEQELRGFGLTVSANCQDGSGQHDALRLFRTITFAR